MSSGGVVEKSIFQHKMPVKIGTNLYNYENLLYYY